MPVVICQLASGESMITEKGSMVWMSPNIEMQTSAGGIGKAFGRMFSGESIFQNIYTARGGAGMIAFASSFPGSIREVEVMDDRPMVVQKAGFLAAEEGVELSIFFQKKTGAGFFGGEGFIMQKLSGRGKAFVEIDGSAVEYELKAGEKMVVDSGNLAMMDATCSIDIQTVKGVKNVLFGGEGLFNTVVTGPGRIVLQTMPINNFAAAVACSSGLKGLGERFFCSQGFGGYRIDERADALDAHLHHVAGMDRTDTGGGAGEDHVARFQGEGLREIAHQVEGVKDEIAGVGVLLPLPVDKALDLQPGPGVHIGDDTGTDGAEGIKALAQRPLPGGGLEIPGGDVVAHGVAQNIVRGLLRGDMAGMPANDHYQLRLILYLPGQGAGIEDLLPMGGQAAGRLKEDVWVGGNGGVELLGVIPVVEAHRQHLAGRAGGQELQTVQEKTLSGLLPPAKQVTGQGVDHVVLHAAIGGAVRPQKTDEFCHLALPPALRMKDASCF